MPLRIVKGDIYKVDRRTYVVMRSFLDSRPYTPTLSWNIGVRLDANTLGFRKPGRWALVVSKS